MKIKNLKFAWSAAIIYYLAISLGAALALETTDFLPQLNAVIGTFIGLSVIMIFITVFLVTKLKMGKQWKATLIGFNLLIVALWMLSGYGLIPYDTVGTLLLIPTGIYVGFLALGAGEYFGKRGVWMHPEEAREAELKAEEVEMKRRGAPAAAQEIAEEEKIEEDVLYELRELVKDYKKSMHAPLPADSKEDILGLARSVLKVLEYQDETLQMEGAIVEMAELAGEEAIKDPGLTKQLNTILIGLCNRKKFLDDKSVAIIDGLLTGDIAGLEAGRRERHDKAEGKQEKAAINAIYDLHKKALGILKRIRNELLTDEKLDASEKRLADMIEGAEKRREVIEVKGEKAAERAEEAEERGLEKDEEKEE